jgi:hypothetical protein
MEGSSFETSTLRAICVPANVERLGNACFVSSSGLLVVNFERNSRLKKIGMSVFYQTRLSTICVPSSIEIIQSDAFSLIETLHEVRFEENCRLGEIPSTFAVWTALECLRIPASVKKISPGSGLARLTRISVEDGCAFRIIDNIVVDPAGELVVGFGGDVDIVVPNWVRVVCGGAFGSRVTIRSVAIPPSVEVLGARCFAYCMKLQNVVFEGDSKLRSIESNAFYGCESLTEVRIPKSVISLGAGCFRACTKLAEVIFMPGSNLNKIEAKAFLESALTRICIPATVETVGPWPFPRSCQVSFPWPRESPEFETWRVTHPEAFDNLHKK